MKRKIFMVTIVVILIVATAFMFSGCQFIEDYFNNPDKIDQFYNRLKDSNSSTYEVDLDAMNMKMTIMIQGNIIHTITQFSDPLSSEMIVNERYVELSEDIQYEYNYNNDEELWYRSLFNNFEEESVYDEIADLFVGSNYVYDRKSKAFILKEGVEEINVGDGTYESIQMTIKRGTCKIIITVLSEMTEYELILTFKNINKTSVNLPKEYIDIE